MSNVNGGTVTVRIQGQDVGLADLLTKINQQMAASGQTARTYATQMASITPAVAAVDRGLAQYTVSLANVARAQGDTLGAQKLLANGLAGITANTTAANQVLLKLQQTLNAEAVAAEKDAAALAKLNIQKQQLANTPTTNTTAATDAQTVSLGKLVTAYFVATRVVKEFAEVIGEGNQLEKTLTTFKVLSGSQEQYTKNLALAKEQQNLFGGSLQDTVEGMSSFANLSARTGIEITKLTNTARALATIDPAQGFKGAGIALKEFFSGEITSLARRFEIPREALSGVEKITDNVQKFEELQKVLAEFGISQELVTAQAATTAVTYEKLAGSLADARAAIGGALASSLSETATGFTNVFTNIANGFNTLVGRTQQLQGFAGKIFDQTALGGIDAFNAKVREINSSTNASDNALASLIAKLGELTPAEYAYVQALTARGIAAEEAFAALDKNKETLDSINASLAESASVGVNSATALSQLGVELAQVASQSANAAAFAEGLASAVANGLPIEAAFIYLQQFKANEVRKATEAQAEANAVTEVGLQGVELFTQALVAEALEKTNSKIAGDALKLTQEELYNAALAAAQGMGATQQSAAALAGQFSITTQEAYGLISALAQLEVAKAKQELGVQRGGANEREDRLGSDADIIQRAKDAKLRKELAAIEAANALAAADTAGKLDLQRDALARLNKGSVEYAKQLGVVQAAERALLAEQERNAKKLGGGGGAPKLTPNEKINTKLLDDQDKFNAKFEDAEQKHYDKLADIYDKFNQEQQKQFAQNEVSKRRSRADFYGGLQDTAEGVDTAQFAAQYEDAFTEAQNIAASGRAKLANEFLQLRQDQIEEMKQLAEEAAEIKKAEAEGDISEEDAAAQLAYLEGRRKLIEDAQREEQQLLLANGDENVNKLNEQLAAENEAYDQSVDKISTAAERKADAVIIHAQRSKIAVTEENKLLAEQEAHYQRIAQMNGGQVPKNQQGTTAVGSNPGVQGTADAPVHIDATTPIPITTPESLLVSQAALFIVHDADVMASIGDMATRLEAKLGEVVTAVNAAKSDISTAVNSVRDAVGKIRVATPNVVGV